MVEIQVTRHAVQQWCKRFYKDEKVPSEQYKMIGEYIVKVLYEEHGAEIKKKELTSGMFKLPDYEMEVQVRDNTIVTVIPLDDGGTCKKSSRS